MLSLPEQSRIHDLLNSLSLPMRSAMLQPLLSVFVVLFLVFPSPLLSAIIADHATTDLGAIPASWINTVKDTLRLSYGHSSHGSQPVEGMKVLASNATYDTLYALNVDGAIQIGILSLDDYTPAGDLGDNGDTAWATATRTYLDSSSGTGTTRNVVIWSWCGGVSDNTEQGIDTYLSTMNQLELEYPAVTFVYMTGHLDGTGEGGTLHRLNNRIRAYCRANNKVLYDFADIESYNPDGAYFLNLNADDNCDYDGGNWATQWCTTHSSSELCAPVAICAHSQSLNCNLKARAFWWMLARVAGWDGGPVLSQGAPSGQLAAGTTQATLSLHSNEDAICRYATAGGVDYSAMTDTFSATGGTTHQHTLSNLGTGQLYRFYVRCEDKQYNNSNQEDFLISFSIGIPNDGDGDSIDTTPPILSQGAPSGQLAVGTTQATLSLHSNENATCRYATCRRG